MPGEELSATQRDALAAIGIDQWVLRDEGLRVPETPDWAELNETIRACTLCDLHKSRTQAVCGVGSFQADCLIVGEAPGAEEDRQGEPFVGRAGLLLNEMLRAIGLSRDEVFIANILKCRPPQNRDPSASESEACLPYLERQIALLNPRLIIVVGRVAAQNLLATSSPIGRMRGKVHAYGAEQIPVVVTYHPAYLLRSPAQKAKSWEDLLLARGILAGASA